MIFKRTSNKNKNNLMVAFIKKTVLLNNPFNKIIVQNNFFW